MRPEEKSVIDAALAYDEWKPVVSAGADARLRDAVRAYRKSLEPRESNPWAVGPGEACGAVVRVELSFNGHYTSIAGPRAAIERIAALLNANIEEGSER